MIAAAMCPLQTEGGTALAAVTVVAKKVLVF
jgi:hypothetical protein